MGSAAILAAVSGILPETLRVDGLVFEIGLLPRRGFGKMPNPAAKMEALPIAHTFSPANGTTNWFCSDALVWLRVGE